MMYETEYETKRTQSDFRLALGHLEPHLTSVFPGSSSSLLLAHRGPEKHCWAEGWGGGQEIWILNF